MNETESLKVVVFIGAGDPELRAEIENLPPRARAARMRALANFGLQSLKAGAPPVAATPPTNSSAPPAQTDAKKAAAERLRGKLKASMGE